MGRQSHSLALQSELGDNLGGAAVDLGDRVGIVAQCGCTAAAVTETSRAAPVRHGATTTGTTSRRAAANLDTYFPQTAAHSRRKPGTVTYRESETEQSLACMSAGQELFLLAFAEGVGFEPTRTVTSSSGFQDPPVNVLDLRQRPRLGKFGHYSAGTALQAL